jgi:hypothetical protein
MGRGSVTREASDQLTGRPLHQGAPHRKGPSREVYVHPAQRRHLAPSQTTERRDEHEKVQRAGMSAASRKTCARSRTGRSGVGSEPAPRIRHGLRARIPSSTAVMRIARSSR